MYHFTIVLRQKCSKQIWAWVTLNLSDSQRVQRLLDNHISVIQLQLIKCRANPHSTLMYGLVTGTSPNIILDLDRFALRLLCNFAHVRCWLQLSFGDQWQLVAKFRSKTPWHDCRYNPGLQNEWRRAVEAQIDDSRWRHAWVYSRILFFYSI